MSKISPRIKKNCLSDKRKILLREEVNRKWLLAFVTIVYNIRYKFVIRIMPRENNKSASRIRAIYKTIKKQILICKTKEKVNRKRLFRRMGCKNIE